MSIKVTPLSATLRSKAIASPSSGGGPHTPRPVMRMAPKPRRPTVGPFPRVSVDGSATGAFGPGITLLLAARTGKAKSGIAADAHGVSISPHEPAAPDLREYPLQRT